MVKLSIAAALALVLVGCAERQSVDRSTDSPVARAAIANAVAGLPPDIEIRH